VSKQYYVYIMSSKRRALYTGVTRDLKRRVYEHKHRIGSRYTSRHNINRLVYFETCADIREALAREKRIKRWLRARKVALIESVNPRWDDLSVG
jgi:putative endonuclease